MKSSNTYPLFILYLLMDIFIDYLVATQNVQILEQSLLKTSSILMKLYTNAFLSSSITEDSIQQFSKRYRNHSEAVQLVTMLIDLMGYFRNRNRQQLDNNILLNQSLPLIISNNQPLDGKKSDSLPILQQKADEARIAHSQSDKLLFINTESCNGGHLKLLNYIVEKPLSGQREYSHCFQSLRFDLSIQEAKEVKNMVRADIRAFSYLSNYLYSSCVNLDKENKTIRQINERYQEFLNQLCIENHPAPPINKDYSELDKHPQYKAKYISYFRF